MRDEKTASSLIPHPHPSSLICEVGMHETPRTRLVAYGVALLATVGSLLIRWPLWPVLGNAVPHMNLLPRPS